MQRRRAAVDRYTVDNRYDDALVTLVRAPLQQGRKTFTDLPEHWDDEELVAGRPSALVEQLAVPGGGPVAADLQPGRVFLHGRFQVLGAAEAPSGFEVDENGPERWLRIDRLPLVKDTLKKLYSDLLVAGGSRD